MIHYALIVAGGKGLRMGSALPKQFLLVSGVPILMRTLGMFRQFDERMRIILVLPHEQQDYWKGLCNEYHFTIKHQVVDGGETRFSSVKRGLDLITTPGLVGVHDGVRPFVSTDVIKRCYVAAAVKKAVIPVVGVVESIRHLKDGGSETVNRDNYKLVQTPQVFDVDLLKKAYLQPYKATFTDDASVVEAIGVPVFLVKGSFENIKITTPFDLKIANALCHV
ncbi:MAG: 2-C-methyl-D-erythritol 4-phosphate cytidylyltransferase [Bacteroidaceae bacterium]|nr:2-C-methyl-D-erythritol 4-phosphate cytidylyltransferase [Bacteroidaceae bacterium]